YSPARRIREGLVAEVAKTLESNPAMHPICGQIGYQRLPPAVTAQSLVTAYLLCLSSSPHA
ncbi:MAG: hypothetical protein MUC83_07735, partial [Pirellula sp.]|nr:hypothetical protein [Pirellula sp.]